ncbi:Chromosome partition protein Smc [Carpediemonas membranifera]|uniref:Chromosome partition protein Smc n=1 Tax=Carpediemonas membranifera TaxID=201153 RepID=A0A8J6E5Q0_9EUKA|nr:Chromosome partition protein Smc [Carpediemonas membranifera]|eukprot:KAG9396112.1 Chromosome partition protein Smc [Carpediemonas membranifera]
MSLKPQTGSDHHLTSLDSQSASDHLFDSLSTQDTIMMQKELVKAHEATITSLKGIIRRKDRTIQQASYMLDNYDIPAASNDITTTLLSELHTTQNEIKTLQKEIKALSVLQGVKNKEIVRLTEQNETDGGTSQMSLLNETRNLEMKRDRLQTLLKEKEASFASQRQVLLYQKDKHDRIAAVVREANSGKDEAEITVGVRSARQTHTDKPTIIYQDESGKHVSLDDYFRLEKILGKKEAQSGAMEAAIEEIDRDMEALIGKNRVLAARQRSLLKRQAAAERELARLDKDAIERTTALKDEAMTRMAMLESELSMLMGRMGGQ